MRGLGRIYAPRPTVCHPRHALTSSKQSGSTPAALDMRLQWSAVGWLCFVFFSARGSGSRERDREREREGGRREEREREREADAPRASLCLNKGLTAN